MFLSNLKLTNFRNYNTKEYDFKAPTVVLLGQNAIGKTNVLEAIFLFVLGESFRAQKIEEMVAWGAEVAHITGTILVPEITNTNFQNSNNDQITKLKVTLTRGVVQGRRVQKRSFKVNGVSRRRQDFVGNLKAVIFRPEDLDLLAGTKTGRRKFLDTVLSQTDTDYRNSLQNYEKGLKRRNKILELIAENKTDRKALWFWDQLLIKEGDVITNRRRELISWFNTKQLFLSDVSIVYDPSIISPARLKQYESEEVFAKHTLVGPHRDDWNIVTSNPFDKLRASLKGTKDLAKYGSRGEQRMAVLWLKLNELDYIENKTNVRPILLLDDIFSELDRKHDEMVLEILGKQQTIIATTDFDFDENKVIKNEVEVIKLN